MSIKDLQDVLTLDIDKLKSDEKSKVLTKIKQLVKASNKEEVKESEEVDSLPYEAVSVVGSKLVFLKFDLESGKSGISKIEQDTRDTKGRNYMASAAAIRIIQLLSKQQKEK